MKISKFVLFLLLFLGFSQVGFSQSEQNLVGYYAFEDLPDVTDSSPSSQHDAKFLPHPENAVGKCGVVGQALEFDGIVDYLVLLGTVNNHFSTTDFTLSFYFKPYSKSGLMDIISKKSNCANVPGLTFRYKANSGELFVEAVQDSLKRADFKVMIDRDNCWHHIALVREGNKMKLYYNAVLQKTVTTVSRINMSNNSTMNIAGGPCLGITDTQFRGLIDELRIYNRALTKSRIEELYFAPDRIYNRDTIIYLGESVDLNTNSPCGITYQWLPDENISDAQIANPTVFPTESTTYEFQVNAGQCIASDTVLITVVDPKDVDCTTLLFPTAFTPNGDGLNDDFSFDTPLVVLDKFKLLEIFDRWGNRVFYTEDPAIRWDGVFGNQAVNPGVYLYRTQYGCKGEDINQVGQVTLIR